MQIRTTATALLWGLASLCATAAERALDKEAICGNRESPNNSTGTIPLNRARFSSTACADSAKL